MKIRRRKSGGGASDLNFEGCVVLLGCATIKIMPRHYFKPSRQSCQKKFIDTKNIYYF